MRTIEEQNETIDKLKVSSLKKKFDMATQTTEAKPFATNIDIITDRKADLLVEIESLKRRLSKMDKRIAYHKNKENKFLFFLFTLQNKGIPVNELYEKEGIKDIATSRFADIMAEEQQQNNPNNQSSLMFSFYSDDSYEPINCGPDFCQIRKKPVIVPALNLANLPEYETSSEEDAGENEEEELKDNSKNMNTQDYQQSIKYIENYYSQQQQRAHRQNFDDTEELGDIDDGIGIPNDSEADISLDQN